VSRGWKLGLAIAGAALALNLILAGLNSLTGGTPGGPTSSSYATGSDGAAAYAALLARAGHRVTRLRQVPSAGALEPTETLVLLEPPFVLQEDASALRAFVTAGGRLVVDPGASSWLSKLEPGAPVHADAGVATARPIAPAVEVAGVDRVEAAGEGSWSELHGALPVLGQSGRAFAAVENLGRGRVVLLADDSFLHNGYLSKADNARFALAAAGAADRPVAFLESYHGYGTGSGLSAIPDHWVAAIAFAALAVLVFMLARVRRFGPPEPDARELAPPRAEYVEALGATVARTRDRTAALEALRAEVRRRVAVRAGLGAAASDDQIAAAATRLGLPPDEIAILTRPVARGDELQLGRALAATAHGRNRPWMN
jgi:hypothetical protein